MSEKRHPRMYFILHGYDGRFNFPAKKTNIADEESQFKKYQAQMALKRQRKTERNKVDKKKDRFLPARLTIQRQAAQVKGSSQKYARMGPLKRIEIPEEDLSKPASIDIVRCACITGFKMDGFHCDLLETERGPSLECLDEVKNLNGTIFVRFVYNSYKELDLEASDESDGNENNAESKSSRMATTLPHPLPEKGAPAKPKKMKLRGSSGSSSGTSGSFSYESYPTSLSVASMLKLGRVVQPTKREDILVQVEEFHITTGWSMARDVTFSVEVDSFGEGGFRKAYRCESEDNNFSGLWVLKKYNEKALEDMAQVGMEEEEHARKQSQMHALAKNVASQVSKYVDHEFGEFFSYDSMFLGKIKSTKNEKQSFVTIEKFIEGKFIKYVNNNGIVTANRDDVITQKAEALVHFSYQMSKGEFVLLDLQGTGYKLYDPEIASTMLVNAEGSTNFCIGNLSIQAIDGFFEEHICNFYCKQLGLKDDKPYYNA